MAYNGRGNILHNNRQNIEIPIYYKMSFVYFSYAIRVIFYLLILFFTFNNEKINNLIKNNEKIILYSLGYISFLSLLYYRDINFLKIIALNIIFNLLSIPALYFLLFKLTQYFSLKTIIILLLTLIKNVEQVGILF